MSTFIYNTSSIRLSENPFIRINAQRASVGVVHLMSSKIFDDIRAYVVPHTSNIRYHIRI